ncbi:hypothetical protein IAD21_03884 [Abditibacteriota bacterium]|nr:hypothetical protein IAD21_03884 [Abditibacteriota bacterium]
MPSSLISLESIQIASPCRAEWDGMQGNQCVRFCPSCGKNVYNVAAMTRDEAMRLIEQKEGKLCVRLHRRSDGTVLTSDCPIGEATRKRQKRGIQLLAGALGFVAALFGLQSIKAALSSNAGAGHPETEKIEITTGICAPPYVAPTPSATAINQLGKNV